MNELTKTIIFVAAAAAIGLAAVSSHFMNRPTNAADFELVGKPFFEDFTSASQAQNLEVVAVDAENGRLKRFSVQNKSGLWRIPSHFNYPAEAAHRLATTATSVIGINRDSLAGRLKKEHERLGVVDPLSDDIEDPETVGKRITMKDADGEVVVDYIIGKEVDQEVVLSRTERPFGNEGNEKYYYVRRPDEQQTYKVKLDIDLSTKFSDWIDPDLLRLNRSELTRIMIDNYSIEEDRSAIPGQMTALFKAQGDQIAISRKSSTDSWELDGLKPETEELDTSRINEMIGVFDQLKIAGVRPKFKYKDHLLLTADLQLNRRPEFEANPQEFGQAINRLQDELDQKGFNLAGNAEKMELVSKHGELELGTEKGIVYTLHIGEAVEGDEDAIEIGIGISTDSNKKTDTSSTATDPVDSNSDSDGNETGNAADDGDEESQDDPLADAKNRYLMVRVSFDEALINPKPEKPIEPVEPVAPEGYQPPSDDEPAKSPDEAAAPDDVEKPGKASGEKSPDQDETPARNPEFVKYDEAKKQHEQQKIEFELAQTRFGDETEQYEEKIAEGKKLVDELNERFGDWYYVMSADNLKMLQSERKDLVTIKQPPPAEPEVMPPRPNISFPSLPGATPEDDKPGEPVDGQPNTNSDEAAKETGKSKPVDSPTESDSDQQTDATKKREPPKESETEKPDEVAGEAGASDETSDESDGSKKGQPDEVSPQSENKEKASGESEDN